MYVELRLITTTYLYDDPDHPNRVTGTLQAPPYTVEDRVLLAALEMYESSLCRCGWPRAVAWHTEMDGWLEYRSYQCFACTAMRAPDKDGKRVPVMHGYVVSTRPDTKPPLRPFVLGVTTHSDD